MGAEPLLVLQADAGGDVAFEERTEQVLRLLAHAVRHVGDETALRPLLKKAKASATEAVALGIPCSLREMCSWQGHLHCGRFAEHGEEAASGWSSRAGIARQAKSQ